MKVFEELVEEAFKERRGQKHNVIISSIELLVKKSKYETRSLEAALQKAFKDEQLFASNEVRPNVLKVAVTATTGSGTQPYLFSNYNVSKVATGATKKGISSMNYRRHRTVDTNKKLKIWEA